MTNIAEYAQAFDLLFPAICVIGAIIFTALWNLFSPDQKGFTPIFALVGLVLAGALLTQQFDVHTQLFGGLYTVDRLTVAFGLIAVAVAAIVVLMTMGYESQLGPNAGEFYAILLTATVSVMLLAGATDLVMLFVALETLSLCCVMLAGSLKKNRKSNEATLKYFLAMAATTATLLYGLSFVYGMVGSTNYADIHIVMSEYARDPSLIFLLMLVLLLSAIGFKLSMVPFHMWTPDVYEGAPTPVTAFLSIGSKAGGFVVAIRLLPMVFIAAAEHWVVLVSLLALLSMIVGNLIALVQSSFKRMLAFSSIAHVGYILIGLVSGTAQGLSAMMFYIMVYGLMNLGAFTGAMLFSNETGSDNIDDFAGLIRKRPWLVVGLSVCLLNLAALPVPPAGFLAKVFVFWSGAQMQGYPNLGWALVICALVTSVPAIYYYTRVVIKMVVREPSEKVLALADDRKPLADPQTCPMTALAVCVIGLLIGSFSLNPLIDLSEKAITPITNPPPLSSLPGGIH